MSCPSLVDFDSTEFRAPSALDQKFLINLTKIQGNAYLLPLHHNNNHSILIRRSLTRSQISTIRLPCTPLHPSGELLFPSASSTASISKRFSQAGFVSDRCGDKRHTASRVFGWARDWICYYHPSGLYGPGCEGVVDKIWARRKGGTGVKRGRAIEEDNNVEVAQPQAKKFRAIKEIPTARKGEVTSMAAQVDLDVQSSWSPALDASLRSALGLTSSAHSGSSPYSPPASVSSNAILSTSFSSSDSAVDSSSGLPNTSFNSTFSPDSSFSSLGSSSSCDSAYLPWDSPASSFGGGASWSNSSPLASLESLLQPVDFSSTSLPAEAATQDQSILQALLDEFDREQAEAADFAKAALHDLESHSAQLESAKYTFDPSILLY